jgi:hypothetical protein
MKRIAVKMNSSQQHITRRDRADEQRDALIYDIRALNADSTFLRNQDFHKGLAVKPQFSARSRYQIGFVCGAGYISTYG